MVFDFIGRLFKGGSADARPAAPCDRMFVYGTLMNLHEIRDIWNVEPERIEKATMRGDLYSAPNQPIMLDGRGTVHGLVLTVPSLAQNPGVFDSYEACYGNGPNSFHLRLQRQATTESGEKVTAWAYLGNPRHQAVKRTCVEANLIREGMWSASPNRMHGPLK
jgi:gamma-glutamylcyclotransferase (GGCT)/AIG2-like uncharacterized protein YtfP